MTRLKCDDAFKVMERMINRGETVDCVITDPLYEIMPSKELLEDLKQVCPDGNILLFSMPGGVYPKADEYLHWVKPVSTKNTRNKCSSFVEAITVFRGRNGVFNNNGHWSERIGVYGDLIEEAIQHPFQKPLSLIERLIRIYSNENDLVFDPFMGSGTTGVACVRQGRRFLGVEKDVDRFVVARNRLRGLQGG